MAKRTHPELVATRVTPGQRAMIEAAAASKGVSVATLLREIVVPAVCIIVTRTASEIGATAKHTP
jgi:uncharacterized protein (DUF1778 family)